MERSVDSYGALRKQTDYWEDKLEKQKNELIDAIVAGDDPLYERLLEDVQTTAIILWRHYRKVEVLVANAKRTGDAKLPS